MSSFVIYIIGFVILIAGLAYAASIGGLDGRWIVAGAVILLGLGVILGASHSKGRD